MTNFSRTTTQNADQATIKPDSQMRAMWLLEPGKFELRRQPIYEIGSDEVLVQMAYCGICPWDIRVYAGKKSVPLPRVMGHEATGRIIALGPQVKHLAVGQRVMVDFIVKCGVCVNCRRGRENRCLNPQFPNGAYEDFAVMPFRNIHLIQHETTSFKAAAFTEPLACVVRAQKMFNLAPGEVEMVVGAGPIGLMHLQVAKRYGTKVIVADLIPERLELAKQLGADIIYNNTEGQLKEIVNQATDGQGVDAAVVAVGVAPLVVQAAECLGEGGRLNIFAGIYPPTPLNIDPNLIHYKELVLTGSADSTPQDMYEALQFIETGQVQVEKLISHTFSLEDLQHGFELVKHQQGLKVMVEIGGESI
jgi:L-iditol 2-dehydrogenase